ncbi:MAG: hypothetical protein LUF04_14630 [Bacteroides sp.]|nr:hypothetical protein [Bacteroides sp.]
MDYMNLESEFPEEHTGSVPEDTWEYEEETLPDREEEETLWIDADLPDETAGEEWAADADADASDASAPGANRMRIVGRGLPHAEEPSRWRVSFCGFGKCVCGCRSYVGSGKFCNACGHSYEAHAR